MASTIDVFINPCTHIEVIDEESVKLMHLEYGNPAVTHGDQRYTAYGKQVVKGSLKDYPRHAGLHFSMNDVCLLNKKNGCYWTEISPKGLMVGSLRKIVTTMCRTLIPIQHLNF